MTFWPWALQAYARDGAAEACLQMQDRHGQSVPYLLWAAWAAQTGRALTGAQLRAGASMMCVGGYTIWMPIYSAFFPREPPIALLIYRL